MHRRKSDTVLYICKCFLHVQAMDTLDDHVQAQREREREKEITLEYHTHEYPFNQSICLIDVSFPAISMPHSPPSQSS